MPSSYTVPRHTQATGPSRAEATRLSNDRLSETISFARLALIVGLVFLHYVAYPNSMVSPFDGVDPNAHQVATFVNSFVLFFFFSAVPLLSMVSGWLYFTFDPDAVFRSLADRIKRRVSSLYVPLVCWNLLYVALLVAASHYWPKMPGLDQLNLNAEVAGWRDYVNAIFALTKHPLAFQFWFVRDLLVTVLISPLLWVLLRRAPHVGAAILGAAWLLGHDLWIFFRADVAFFFYLGGVIRLKKASLGISWHATIALMAVYVALVALRAIAPLFIDVQPHRPEWLDAATRAMRLVGVAATWGICLRLSATATGRHIARYGGLAFFLFAVHFPLIAIVKAVLWPWLPAQTDAWMLAHYVASVSVTVSVGLVAGYLLARIAPAVFAAMNGGRIIPIAAPAARRSAAT
jgi:succinoglycan biosynthesis protein ExoH